MNLIDLHNLPIKTVLHELIIILFIFFMACPARTAEPAHIGYDAEAPSEYELKAIYLYNFCSSFSGQMKNVRCPKAKLRK